MGVVEDAEPIELRLGDELFQNFNVTERLPGEADDEAGAEGDSRDGFANFLESLEEDVRAGAALHGFEDG